MDATTTLFVQEDAAAVLTVVEDIAPRPQRPHAAKRLPAAEVLVLVPTLRQNALTLRVGDGDLIFLAAGAAGVTIPVLHDRQMIDRQWHEQSEVAMDSGATIPVSLILLRPPARILPNRSCGAAAGPFHAAVAPPDPPARSLRWPLHQPRTGLSSRTGR